VEHLCELERWTLFRGIPDFGQVRFPSSAPIPDQRLPDRSQVARRIVGRLPRSNIHPCNPVATSVHRLAPMSQR
jgi:hypothetical protein